MCIPTDTRDIACFVYDAPLFLSSRGAAAVCVCVCARYAVTQNDMVTSVEWDLEGQILAIGDAGGRICLYKRSNPLDNKLDFQTEFQSHDPAFDYLTSQEIEEHVKVIKWLRRQYNSRMLLSTNGAHLRTPSYTHTCSLAAFSPFWHS